MKEKIYRWVGKFTVEAGLFLSETGKDFVSVWKLYPNVLIWCAIAFSIAALV